jgi:hypothetical protein
MPLPSDIEDAELLRDCQEAYDLHRAREARQISGLVAKLAGKTDEHNAELEVTQKLARVMLAVLLGLAGLFVLVGAGIAMLAC